MPPIRVVVSGTGNMGRQVLQALCAEPDLEPVGVIEGLVSEPLATWPLPDGSGEVPFGPDAARVIAESRPEVLVDFTNAVWTPLVTHAALEHGVRPVIGTTGLPQPFLAELEASCRERRLGAVVAPNFALGAVLLMHMARIAARHYDHAEVIELHHERKADAPSGTALATARAMREARGRPFQRPEPEAEPLAGTRGGALEGVGVHAVRLPGLVAHQEVIFGGRGETLTLRHDSTSRECFLPGLLLAIREVVRLDHLVVSLDALLGLR